MKTLTIKTGDDIEDFFQRGRTLAKLIDQQAPLPEWHIISFEDPSDLLELLSDDRLTLFRAIKKQSGSTVSLAERLHRAPAAIERDVDALEKAGLLKIEDGHVHVTAPKIRLEAEF